MNANTQATALNEVQIESGKWSNVASYITEPSKRVSPGGLQFSPVLVPLDSPSLGECYFLLQPHAISLPVENTSKMKNLVAKVAHFKEYFLFACRLQ